MPFLSAKPTLGTSQVITNWDATRGTPLGQRGATRDKSPGTEV